jgi:hypothetical protein
VRSTGQCYRTEIHARLDGGEDVDVIAEPAPLDRRPTGTDGGWKHTADGESWRKLLRVAIDRGAIPISTWRRIESRLRAPLPASTGCLQAFSTWGDLGEDLVRQRPEVLSRIKILAGLDIAERRRPRTDGSFARARALRGPQHSWPWTFRVSSSRLLRRERGDPGSWTLRRGARVDRQHWSWHRAITTRFAFR